MLANSRYNLEATHTHTFFLLVEFDELFHLSGSGRIQTSLKRNNKSGHVLVSLWVTLQLSQMTMILDISLVIILETCLQELWTWDQTALQHQHPSSGFRRPRWIDRRGFLGRFAKLEPQVKVMLDRLFFYIFYQIGLRWLILNLKYGITCQVLPHLKGQERPLELVTKVWIPLGSWVWFRRFCVCRVFVAEVWNKVQWLETYSTQLHHRISLQCLLAETGFA